MTFGITAGEALIAGSALVGGVMASGAAKSAANTQAAAANNASNASLQATQDTNALQAAMYKQGMTNQSPYLKSGNLALAALTGGLGLGNPYGNPNSGVASPNGPIMSPGGGNGSGPPGFQVAPPGSNQITDPRGNRVNAQGVAMSPITGAAMNNGPTMGFGGSNGYSLTGSGTQMQANQPMFTDANGNTVDANGQPITVSNNNPYGIGNTNYGADPGQMAAVDQQYGANGGQFTQTFKPSDLTIDPSYQWRLQQGQQQLDASAASRGLLGSGQNLKDIVNYGQGAASQEYSAAYDRFMNNQNTLYNRLAGLAGVGQAATNSSTAAGANAAAGIGANTMAGVSASNNYLTGGAAAQAAGQVGSANAISGALNNGMNGWMGLQYLNKIPSGAASTGVNYGGYGTTLYGTGYGPE